jgi:flagellar basal-body rod protein FlgB
MMPISDLPLFSTLRQRLHWHEARQKVLAENVANADMPGFRARDLTPFELSVGRGQPAGGVRVAVTQASHIGNQGRSAAAADVTQKGPFEVRPQGNAVNLEDEMMKVAQNQMDHQAAVALYTRSLGLIKTAFGRR